MGKCGGDTVMFLLEMHDHSIALYWVIMCCDWAGGAFACPNLEAASGVKMYSLMKPKWMSSFRYFQRLQQ